jgi:hypothetical protein
VLSCLVLAACAGRHPDPPESAAAAATSYRLLSWQDSSGGWNFFFASDAPGQRPSAGEVFQSHSVLHNLDQLRRRTADLPRDSEVTWCAEPLCLAIDAAPAAHPRLRMPQPGVADELVRFAAQHQVRIATAASLGPRGLYSWRGADGSWNFVLFSRAVGAVTADEIFHGNGVLHGLDPLQRELADLPKDAEIVWCGRPSCLAPDAVPVEGDRLSMPPPAVVARVKRLAGERRLRIMQAADLVGVWVLYSWRDATGAPRFFFFPGALSRLPSPEEVFGGRNVVRGLDQLERIMADFEPGTEIYWRTQDSRLARGGQRIAMPSPEAVAEIRRFAAAHGIQLRFDSAVDGAPKR